MYRKIWLVIAITLAYAAIVWTSALQQSLTADERIHLNAGYSYLARGDFGPNPEHPPLAKQLSALPLVIANAFSPFPEQGDLISPPNRERVASIVALARLPMALLAGLMVAIAALWATQLFGLPAGICTALLLGATPEVLNHGRWVTTDLPLATFSLLSLFSAWHWLKSPTGGRAALMGLSLGGALAVKFSAVMVPFGMLPLLAASWMLSGRPIPTRRERVIGLTWLVAGPFLVLSLSYWSLLWPELYMQGALRVNTNHGLIARYLMGALNYENFPLYFPMAYVLKTPLPILIALMLGIIALFMPRPRAERGDALLFLGAGAIVFAFMAWKANNIGVRYVLPATPFFALLIASGVKALGKRAVPLFLGLSAWCLVETAQAWPHLLGYFNQAFNKPGIAYLDDSNVEWGEGFIALRKGMQERNLQRLSFGGAFYDYLTDPSYYGVELDRLSGHERGRLKPGWYGFSPPFLLHAPGFLWLAYQPAEGKYGGFTLHHFEHDPTDQARAIYQALLKDAPTSWIWYHYAAFEEGCGNREIAFQALDKSLELWPENLAALGFRASLYAIAGEVEKSQADTARRAACEEAFKARQFDSLSTRLRARFL